ncbi:MAG: hypothetical protein ACK4IT_09595, partial [Thioalkalivibrionaceae bacterium]
MKSNQYLKALTVFSHRRGRPVGGVGLRSHDVRRSQRRGSAPVRWSRLGKQSLMIAVVATAALGLSACAVGPTNEQTGTVLGGVLGGLAGTQIGGGTGRTAAIIGGTIIGAAIGGAGGGRQGWTQRHPGVFSPQRDTH